MAITTRRRSPSARRWARRWIGFGRIASSRGETCLALFDVPQNQKRATQVSPLLYMRGGIWFRWRLGPPIRLNVHINQRDQADDHAGPERNLENLDSIGDFLVPPF